MATKSIDATRVLDRVNLSTTDIAAAKVEEFIDDAIATIENETGRSIGELSGSAGSKSIVVNKNVSAVITNLSAIYCIVYMTGGKAVGLSFSLGDVRVDALDRAPPIQLLGRQVNRDIERLRKKYFGRTSASGWMG